MRRLMVVVAGMAGAVGVAACDSSITEPPPGVEITCAAAPTPARFLVERNGVADAAPTDNRFIQPPHWADTLFIAATPTAPAMLVIASHGGRCTSLLDSLVFFGPITWKYHDAP